MDTDITHKREEKQNTKETASRNRTQKHIFSPPCCSQSPRLHSLRADCKLKWCCIKYIYMRSSRKSEQLFMRKRFSCAYTLSLQHEESVLKFLKSRHQTKVHNQICVLSYDIVWQIQKFARNLLPKVSRLKYHHTQTFVLPTYYKILHLLYSLLHISLLNPGHTQGVTSLFDVQVYSVFGNFQTHKQQTTYISINLQLDYNVKYYVD